MGNQPTSYEDTEEYEVFPLKDLDFTDLYLSETGSIAKIRGVLDEDDPLVTVPFNALTDLVDVHKKVLGLGLRENEFVLDHDSIRYRVSKINSDSGTNWYALRRSMDPIPRLRSLLKGVPIPVLRTLGRIGKRPNRGLILMSGATGSGKTTTICSLLSEYLYQYGDIATTIEDPPELKLEGEYRGGSGHCFQVKVLNGDFATPLRASLRYQPRYILLGEIRDPDGASEALRAAISGHIVLSTIHSGSIPEAIQSMLKLVSAKLDVDLARNMLSDGLAAVMNQQLVRLKTNGVVERRVKLETLFIGDSTQGTSAAAIRSKIREGKVQSLNDDIEQQFNKIMKGGDPFMLTERR